MTPLNAQHLSLYLEFLNSHVNHFSKCTIFREGRYYNFLFLFVHSFIRAPWVFSQALRLSAKSFLVFPEYCNLQERCRSVFLKMLMSKLSKFKTVIIVLCILGRYQQWTLNSIKRVLVFMFINGAEGGTQQTTENR